MTDREKITTLESLLNRALALVDSYAEEAEARERESGYLAHLAGLREDLWDDCEVAGREIKQPTTTDDLRRTHAEA